MAPLSKDTVELASPIAEPTVSQSDTQTKPAPGPSGHLRSDALSLEVAVKVHGSRVTQVVRGVTPHTEPFEEQTSTMIVFPQGAVLRLGAAVNSGQMLVLTNLKTRQDAICRVVKVRANANLPGYVEVEFTHQQPGYWGVNFPSQAPAAVSQTPSAPAPVAVLPEVRPKEKPVDDVSWSPARPPVSPAPRPLEAEAPVKEAKPAVPPARVTPPPKPETSFISIGSQEDVQAFASSTTTMKPGRVSEANESSFAPSGAGTPAASELPPAPEPAPPAPISIAELRGDAPPSPPVSIASADVSETLRAAAEAAEAPPESAQPIFGRFSSTASSAASHEESEDTFGARLDSSAGVLGTSRAASNQSGMLVAIAVGVLAVGLAGGIFYFRNRPSTSSAPKNSPVNAIASNTNPAPAAALQPAQMVAQSPAVHTGQPSGSGTSIPPTSAINSGAASVTPVGPGAPASITVSAGSATPSKSTANAQGQPLAGSKPAAPRVTTDMVSKALNAHPSAPQRDNAGDADAAPVLDSGATPDPDTNALAGIASTGGASLFPPTEAAPAPPVKSGGVVAEPQLKSSVLPIYPLAARQANVQGDVVINATIDKTGNVSQMKVVSGPVLLRQAALDALRRWKYEPSMLDGQPVDVQMLVTIKFRR